MIRLPHPTKDFLLYATGDGLPLGMTGCSAPQDMTSHLAKGLIIDCEKNEWRVGMKGLRNNQHFSPYTENGIVRGIAWSEIGDNTAEEVNYIPIEFLDPENNYENPLALSYGWYLVFRCLSYCSPY